MTVLEHHKKKQFNLNTYLKVETSSLKFKGLQNPTFKTGFIFISIDGDFWFKENIKDIKPIYVIKSKISNIEVLERIN